MNKPIAFVTPWYGEGIGGGAEAELRDLVKHLHARGVVLEVLTTCVRSFGDDWNKNYYKQGTTVANGITVRRFRVCKRNAAAFDAVNTKVMRGQKLSPDEEETFCREMINSPQLYDYMRMHQDEYALFVFIPYMFGTTYYGCQIAPQKSILIPCFHDEGYAYLNCFKRVFSRVRGMVYNAEPERQLAQELYDMEGQTSITMGIGLDAHWTYNAQRFRNKYSISNPFILYAGRKDAGKNVDTLVRYFVEYNKRNHDGLKLVLIGGGKIDIPDKRNIVDLGFVDAQDKYDAYAAASLFCNPSPMESFSLVIMESWLAKRPVVVNGRCAVTRDFVIRANAGLYFENYLEFEGCVRYLLEHETVASKMGENGERYVKSHFAWDAILDKYIEYFNRVGVEL